MDTPQKKTKPPISAEERVEFLTRLAWHKLGIDCTNKDVRELLHSMLMDKLRTHIKARYAHDPAGAWELICWVDGQAEATQKKPKETQRVEVVHRHTRVIRHVYPKMHNVVALSAAAAFIAGLLFGVYFEDVIH